MVDSGAQDKRENQLFLWLLQMKKERKRNLFESDSESKKNIQDL